ncbi:MAG: hypothetical protein WA709_37210 [Stellaceae bacterium]
MQVYGAVHYRVKRVILLETLLEQCSKRGEIGVGRDARALVDLKGSRNPSPHNPQPARCDHLVKRRLATVRRQRRIVGRARPIDVAPPHDVEIEQKIEQLLVGYEIVGPGCSYRLAHDREVAREPVTQDAPRLRRRISQARKASHRTQPGREGLADIPQILGSFAASIASAGVLSNGKIARNAGRDGRTGRTLRSLSR